MRKVLIGCGVFVLLAMGFIGYAGYRLWPSVTSWHQSWIEAVNELEALDASHPFAPEAQTELDTGRFDLMLDVRGDLAAYFGDVTASLEELGRRGKQDDGPGWLELSSSMFELMTPMLHQFAVHLERAGMGPTEFSWHTRVLWAALARVDAGVAGPELEPLRGEYTRFREAYENHARRQKDMQSLEDILRSVPPGMLVTAAEVMARDTERVRRGLAVTDYDFLYLQQSKSIEDLMEVATQPMPGAGDPAEDGDR